jgi:hypothetical protein
MAKLDRTTLGELLQRQLDGDLGPQERRLLEDELRASPELAEEHRLLQDLATRMSATRIPVRPGFREQVMAGLPPAAWEVRAARSWRLPVALLVALAGCLAMLTRFAPEGLRTKGLFAGTLVAVGDLLRVSVVTGAGLLGASWKGLQAGIGELFASSPMTAVGLLMLLAGLNFLFFLGLRSRKRTRAREIVSKNDP